MPNLIEDAKEKRMHFLYRLFYPEEIFLTIVLSQYIMY